MNYKIVEDSEALSFSLYSQLASVSPAEHPSKVDHEEVSMDIIYKYSVSLTVRSEPLTVNEGLLSETSKSLTTY